MRAPFQVLIIPYIRATKSFIIFKRKDFNIWQFISGGGENKETPTQAMKREIIEETGIKKYSYFRLASLTTIPAEFVGGVRWSEVMIPEICFAMVIDKDNAKKIKLSSEHIDYKIVGYKEAMTKLKYDSNKSALWELQYTLNNKNYKVKSSVKNVVKNYII